MMPIELKKRLQNLGRLIILLSGSLTTFNKSIIDLNLEIQNNNLSKYIGLRYSNYQKNDLLQDLSANGGNIIGNSSWVYSLA